MQDLLVAAGISSPGMQATALLACVLERESALARLFAEPPTWARTEPENQQQTCNNTVSGSVCHLSYHGQRYMVEQVAILNLCCCTKRVCTTPPGHRAASSDTTIDISRTET